MGDRHRGATPNYLYSAGLNRWAQPRPWLRRADRLGGRADYLNQTHGILSRRLPEGIEYESGGGPVITMYGRVWVY